MFSNKSRIIGVDVGGTKMLLQAFNNKMEIVEEKRVPTVTNKGPQGFMEALEQLIDESMHRGIKGIGVALPGIVDKEKGSLVHAPHLPGKNLEVKKILEKRFKKKVLIENDVNAFLFAQMQSEKFKKYKNVIAVMLGTGLGGAAFVEGKLLRGKNGFAGEMGHMIIDNGAKLKTFEENCAGSFIPKIAKELGMKNKFTAYDLVVDNKESRTIKKVLVKNLAVGLSNLNLIFEPEAIILGGSIYKRYLKESKAALKKQIGSRMLNKKFPLIFDLNPKYTAARGVVEMMG